MASERSDDHQAEAEAVVKKTANIPDFGYHGDLPIGETWAFTMSRHRDSDILENSNFETIEKDMSARFPDDVDVVHASHWAVGWMDHLAVRMLGDDGKVTPAGVAILEWKEKLEEYPLADEDDVAQREMEATFENIQEVTQRVLGKNGWDVPDDVPEDLYSDIYRWLSEHRPSDTESSDGGGGYPSEEGIAEALHALGYRELYVSEDGDEADPGFYVVVDDPDRKDVLKLFTAWRGPFPDLDTAVIAAVEVTSEIPEDTVDVIESSDAESAERGRGHVWWRAFGWGKGKMLGPPEDPRQETLPGVSERSRRGRHR